MVAAHAVDRHPKAIVVMNAVLLIVVATLEAAQRVENKGLENAPGHGSRAGHDTACHAPCH